MAKKEEKELTVEEKLKALYELQQVDSKIDELRTLAGELPQEVKDMSDIVEGLKTRLTNIENDIKECETQISEHRVRIENANASISRYKEQQDNVRNNREFDNLSKEIEYQQLDIELSQKKIRNYTADLEARQADKQKTVTDIEEKTVDLNQKKNDLETILKRQNPRPRPSCSVPLTLRNILTSACSPLSSASVRTRTTDWQSLKWSAIVAEVATLKSRHNANLISVNARKSSFASSADVFSLIRKWEMSLRRENKIKAAQFSEPLFIR